MMYWIACVCMMHDGNDLDGSEKLLVRTKLQKLAAHPLRVVNSTDGVDLQGNSRRRKTRFNWYFLLVCGFKLVMLSSEPP